MPDGVLHHRLYAQGGQLEIIVPDVVDDMDLRIAQHFDLRIDPGMLQLLLKRDQRRLPQGLQIHPKIRAEFFDGVEGLLRVDPAQRLDRGERVEDEVRLDLRNQKLVSLVIAVR